MSEYSKAVRYGSVAQSEPPLDERRPKRRRQIGSPGICCYDDGKNSLDCTIHDLSESGVRIRFLKGSYLPAALQLINVVDKLVYEVKVVWSRSTEAGLSVEKTQRMAEMMKPECAYIGRYWLDRATR